MYLNPLILVGDVTPYPLSYCASGLISGKDAFARSSDPCCCFYKFCAIFAGVGTA